MPRPFTTKEEFLQKTERITESGCWLWMGTLEKDGYGRLNKKPVHRLSWEFHRGEIPRAKMILHTCDIHSWVNPDHLYVGSHQDNMDDKVIRDRAAKGSKHGMTVLSEALVQEIAGMIRQGSGIAYISKILGVREYHVKNIKYGNSWRWLTGFGRLDDRRAKCQAA